MKRNQKKIVRTAVKKMSEKTVYERIYDAVLQIPYGKVVATYVRLPQWQETGITPEPLVTHST